MQKLRNEMEADKKASEAAIRLEQAKQAQEKADNELKAQKQINDMNKKLEDQKRADEAKR